jgi:pimeloyl-ACP methyl ester carboxylesterase
MPSIRIKDFSYEYAWWGSGETLAPILLVHEATGSAKGWGEFPERLAEATDRRVYAYSRVGWGDSEPLAAPLAPGYLEAEALDTLTDLRVALNLERVILLGFNEGATISLIHAGATAMPVEGVIAIAPLLFVDEPLKAEIKRIAGRGVPRSMESAPSDPETTMRQWATLWTGARFSKWQADDFARGVTCPVLAFRGENDALTSPEHLERLSKLIRHAELVTLGGCRHAPHLDKMASVVTAVSAFARSLA